MKHTLLYFLLIMAKPAVSQPGPVVRAADFAPAFGFMKGTLTYLDYSTGKPFSMPANCTLLAGDRASGDVIKVMEYPLEPKANGSDTFRISHNGTLLDGELVTVRKPLPDGSLQIVTEKEDADGNDHRTARIRHTYTISKNQFAIRKEVRFTGEEKWIERHLFSFSR